jgi:hypothetical protein
MLEMAQRPLAYLAFGADRRAKPVFTGNHENLLSP